MVFFFFFKVLVQQNKSLKSYVSLLPTHFTFLLVWALPKNTGFDQQWTTLDSQAAASRLPKASQRPLGKLINRCIHSASSPKVSNRKILVANEQWEFSQTAVFLQKKKNPGNLPKRFLKEIVRKKKIAIE